MFDNKFTKRDALAESVKKVMLESQIQRQAEATLNEELGISSKKALPHEYHTQYDALLEAKLASWRTPNYAIQHPNATSEHITKALNEIKIMIHPNATPEHITKFLGDKDSNVRKVAIQHPNATSAHITKALGDEDSNVRKAAIQHPNATPEHITKALNDKDNDVRKAAIQHPNATEAQKEKVDGGDLAALRAGEHLNEKARAKMGPDTDLPQSKEGQALNKAHGRLAGLQAKKLEEKLTKKMSAGDVISDFVHSKDPKFAGKSTKERQKMALGAYYGMHPKKSKKKMDESLESILEEIAYNLQEQFVNIYENGNYDMMNEFLNSLTEEQAELLGLSEEGGILNRVFGRPLAQRQRIEAGQEPITGGTISSGIPAGRQVAAKRQAAADTLAKVQAQRSDYTPQTADVNRARAAAATAGGGGATNATTRSPAPELPEVNTRRADQTDGPGYSYRPPAPAATTPGAQPVAPATTPPAPGSSGPPPASGSSPRPPAPGSSPRPPRQQQPAADRSTASTGGSFAGQPEWAQRAFNPDKGG